MLEDGEPCADFAETLAVKFAIVGQAAELDSDIVKIDYRLMAIRASIPVLQALISSDCWNGLYAKQLDSTLEAVLRLKESVSHASLSIAQTTMKERLC